MELTHIAPLKQAYTIQSRIILLSPTTLLSSCIEFAAVDFRGPIFAAKPVVKLRWTTPSAGHSAPSLLIALRQTSYTDFTALDRKYTGRTLTQLREGCSDLRAEGIANLVLFERLG